MPEWRPAPERRGNAHLRVSLRQVSGAVRKVGLQIRRERELSRVRVRRGASGDVRVRVQESRGQGGGQQPHGLGGFFVLGLHRHQLQHLSLTEVSDSLFPVEEAEAVLNEGSEDILTTKTVRIGTRGSLLARCQSGWVKEALEALRPGLKVELCVIKTMGDKILDVPLAKVGGKGLFVKEIEEALMAGEVDLAVHSMKDVPSVLPESLFIAAVPAREDPRDVWVSSKAGSLEDLPAGARVGTSSLRRGAQVLKLRPDATIESLRGNLDTRLRKALEGQYDGIVLAAAGLHRMGWQDRITSYLDPVDFVPAVGQGALGIEARRDDPFIRELLGPLHDAETALTVTAERSFLDELEGGCQVPIGGHARLTDGILHLDGLVASVDGREVFRQTLSERASLEKAGDLGRTLARELLDAGARQVLEAVYGEKGC